MSNTPYYDNNVDFNGKSILVTGGTGSFGQQFVRTLIETCEPRRLVIFSRDELKQVEMAQTFPTSRHKFLRYFIGDVRDVDRLDMAMQNIEYVVHAAALKHVEVAEYNPFECIRTNVVGAENVVRSAIRNGVRRVIALSTDKAARPNNLYGASKLASEKIFIAANNLSGQRDTRFSIVRYGNVVGSRGSVVPFFRRLVAEGATSLPITDPRMTRFWISLRQGVGFVLSSFDLMQGGEIFVPKLPSALITTLASAIAPDLEQKVIGIRPGEKLHEVMITEDDSRTTIDIGDRYVIEPNLAWWSRTNHQGTQVPDGFCYSSDTNDHWLDVEGVRRLIQASGA